MAKTSHNHQAAFQVLFFLRFVQLASTAIAAYIPCYLFWWYYILHRAVPSGLIVFASTTIAISIECYLSSATLLANRSPNLNYQLLLKTSGVASFTAIYGYYAVRQVPYLQHWCEGNDFASIGADIIYRHCSLACNIIVFGAISVIFTVLITIFAAVGTVREMNASIRLEDEADFSDDVVAKCATDEKKLLGEIDNI